MTEFPTVGGFRRTCDFCGIASDNMPAGAVMVAAPHADICEDCVKICQQVVDDTKRTRAAKAEENGK